MACEKDRSLYFLVISCTVAVSVAGVTLLLRLCRIPRVEPLVPAALEGVHILKATLN